MRFISKGSSRSALVAAVAGVSCFSMISGSVQAKSITITRTTAFEADQANDGTFNNVTGKTDASFAFDDDNNPATPPNDPGTVQSSPILQLGFERQLGSVEGSNFGDPEGQGGQSVVFYLKLPQLLPGRTLETAHFNVSLLHDNFNPPNFLVTPRFSADLYGAGVVRDPNNLTNPNSGTGSFFYTGNTPDSRNGAGPTANKPVQLLQRNFFTLKDPTFSINHDNVPTPGNGDFHFPDVAYVDSTTGYNGRVFQNGSSTPTPVNTNTFQGSLAKGTTGPNGTGNAASPADRNFDGGGDAALAAYIKSLYADPNFINDGNSYVALRLNPDYASNEISPARQAQSGGGTTITVATGTTRYLLPSNSTNFSSGIYAGADPGTLNLGVFLVADANNDDAVTVGDLGILATHFNQTVPAGTTNRAYGDFNGDGSVTVGDLGILATYFNQTVGNGPTFFQALAEYPELQAAVPEPGSVSVLALGAVALLGRRRRMA